MKGRYVERFHGHDTLSGLYLPLYFISSQSISSLAGVWVGNNDGAEI